MTPDYALRKHPCKNIFLASAVACFSLTSSLSAHCQMPCGIYNDQMMYDQVNQFYLTAFKAVKALEHNEFTTDEDKNQFVRWVMTKERLCNETAMLLTTYFFQQKIMPIDDNIDLVKSLHKLLFQLVAIKQNVDIKLVKEFGKEWENFKQLFHPETECVPVIKESSHHKEETLKS